jgi:hypothetical protein
MFHYIQTNQKSTISNWLKIELDIVSARKHDLFILEIETEANLISPDRYWMIKNEKVFTNIKFDWHGHKLKFENDFHHPWYVLVRDFHLNDKK